MSFYNHYAKTFNEQENDRLATHLGYSGYFIILVNLRMTYGNSEYFNFFKIQDD